MSRCPRLPRTLGKPLIGHRLKLTDNCNLEEIENIQGGKNLRKEIIIHILREIREDSTFLKHEQMLGIFRQSKKNYWQYNIAEMKSSRSEWKGKTEESSEKNEQKDKTIGQGKFKKIES